MMIYSFIWRGGGLPPTKPWKGGFPLSFIQIGRMLGVGKFLNHQGIQGASMQGFKATG